jgi:YHS domain-containing protein
MKEHTHAFGLTVGTLFTLVMFVAVGADRVGDVYPLDTCPISGKKLGSMGDPVVKVIDGREVRFCCSGCVGKFEQNTEASFKNVDAKIVETQKPSYPLDVCINSGEKLGKDAVDTVIGNRLYRTCCADCAKEIRANPGKFQEKLDKAVIEKERATYALKKCPVSGESLEGGVKPTEVVVAGHLFHLCCADCKAEIEKNPAKYLDLIKSPQTH